MLKYVVDCGANRFLRTTKGETAADLAKTMDKKDLLPILTGLPYSELSLVFSFCLNLFIQDAKLPGFINYVVRENMNGVNSFFKGGQDTNTPDKNGMTALHYACTLNNNKMLNLLITGSKTIDASKQDSRGNTVLHFLASALQLFASIPENWLE